MLSNEKSDATPITTPAPAITSNAPCKRKLTIKGILSVAESFIDSSFLFPLKTQAVINHATEITAKAIADVT